MAEANELKSKLGEIDARGGLRAAHWSTSPDLLNAPRRNARRFMSMKKTGTRIRTCIVDVIMPPTIGAAIGFITSDPTPVSHRIGARLARTAITVISFGRRRCTAPSIVAASISEALRSWAVA